MLNRLMERVIAGPLPPPFFNPRGLCRDRGAPQPPEGSRLAAFWERHDPFAWCVDGGTAYIYANGLTLEDGAFSVTEAEAHWLREFSDWQQDYLRRWVRFENGHA